MSLPKCEAQLPSGAEASVPHLHACICELPHTGDRHACICGYSWAMEPQEAPGGPELPPEVQAYLEAAGSGLVDLLAPFVSMIQERDDVLARVVPRIVALQVALSDVLAWMERAGVRPNWAQDVRTLEEARALLASLTPKDDDAPQA